MNPWKEKREIVDKRKRIGPDSPLYCGGKSHDGNGYITLTSKEHGDNQGRREHRVVAEQMIGRPLKSDEIVHHKNGDVSDNRPENLSVETRASHNRKHGLGGFAACIKCGQEKWYPPSGLTKLAADYQCRPCRYGRDWDNRRG